MRTPRSLAAALLTVVIVAVASPAHAETLRLDDPAGDGLKGQRLDITAVQLENRDRALVWTVDFVRATYGDLGVRFQARGDRRRDQAVVFTEHRARGDDTVLGTVEGEQRCPGLTVTWDHEADTVVVRLPSRCFRDDSYGAVRMKVITEIGSDADLAPDGPRGGWPWSPWVSRG